MKHQSISFAALVLLGSFILVGSSANPTAADLVVELGSAQVVLAPNVGTTTASIDITFRNPTGSAVPLAAYTLFVDIEPLDMGLPGSLGAELPAGVTFASPAATYAAGSPLAGSGESINLAPAFGDISLGQLQFTDGMIDPGASFVMLTINLEIDRSSASPGVHGIILNPAGENSLNAVAGPLMFTSIPGSLTLTAIPEPRAWLLLLVASGLCAGAALMQKTASHS